MVNTLLLLYYTAGILSLDSKRFSREENELLTAYNDFWNMVVDKDKLKENPTVLPPPTPQLNPNIAKLSDLSNKETELLTALRDFGTLTTKMPGKVPKDGRTKAADRCYGPLLQAAATDRWFHGPLVL